MWGRGKQSELPVHPHWSSFTAGVLHAASAAGDEAGGGVVYAAAAGNVDDVGGSCWFTAADCEKGHFCCFIKTTEPIFAMLWINDNTFLDEKTH